MRRMTTAAAPLRAWTLMIAIAGALLGCHHCGPGDEVGWDSDLVGGACGHDGDCVERCVTDEEFPGGTCTVACDHDGQCPEFSACVEKAGGVCLMVCGGEDDCRIDYACKNIKRHGEGGKTHVCIDD
jgi:hypothetical protein